MDPSEQIRPMREDDPLTAETTRPGETPMTDPMRTDPVEPRPEEVPLPTEPARDVPPTTEPVEPEGVPPTEPGRP